MSWKQGKYGKHEDVEGTDFSFFLSETADMVMEGAKFRRLTAQRDTVKREEG